MTPEAAAAAGDRFGRAITSSPWPIANGGALALVGIYCLVSVYRGNGAKLVSAIGGEGGFLKWLAAAWAVYFITHLRAIQPMGPAIWGLAILVFGFQVFRRAKK